MIAHAEARTAAVSAHRATLVVGADTHPAARRQPDPAPQRHPRGRTGHGPRQQPTPVAYVTSAACGPSAWHADRALEVPADHPPAMSPGRSGQWVLCALHLSNPCTVEMWSASAAGLS